MTGGFGLLANVLFLVVLVEVGGVPEQYGAIISTVTVLLGSFTLTNWWVFAAAPSEPSAGSVLKRGVSYYAIMLTGKGINYLLYLLILSVGVWYPVAWIVGSVVVFVGTYTANRLLWYNTW